MKKELMHRSWPFSAPDFGTAGFSAKHCVVSREEGEAQGKALHSKSERGAGDDDEGQS